uniref:Uncharacterized protein n=1 Tax=Panagrolaimus sp. ES5 TaxID=591445 RepID=A0AC34FJ55_9BILA
MRISLYNWTAQFTINQSSEGYKIYIIKGANSSVDPSNVYANESIEADYDWRKWGPCTIDENGGCFWLTKGGEFSPYLTFTTGYETLINLYTMHTYVDEGYFGETHGMVFTNTNNYYDYNVDYGDYRAMYQVKCDNYIPVPSANIPSKTCTIFSLDAVVYDTTQNFKIITSVSAVVNVSNNFGFITGIANGPDDLIPAIYINAEDEALSLYEPMNDRHNQSISVIPDTNRYIFSLWQMQLQLFPDGIEFQTGKLILRNGVSYFEEGKPFTETNDCIFNSATLSKQYVGTSSFCCDVFNDVQPTKNNFHSSIHPSTVTQNKREKTLKYLKIHEQKFSKKH